MLGSFPGSIHLENYGRRLSFRRRISIILNGIGKMRNLDLTFEYGKRTVYSQLSNQRIDRQSAPTATNFTTADLHTHWSFPATRAWTRLTNQTCCDGDCSWNERTREQWQRRACPTVGTRNERTRRTRDNGR